MDRKARGPNGNIHRNNQKGIRKMARIKRNLSKQTYLLNKSHPAFLPLKRSVFAERRSLLEKTDPTGIKVFETAEQGSSPQNWPPVVNRQLQNSKQKEKRQKTQDLLEDYLRKDIHKLQSNQIRTYYQQVSDGEFSPEYFQRKVDERERVPVRLSQSRLLELHSRRREGSQEIPKISGRREWALNNPAPDDLERLDAGYVHERQMSLHRSLVAIRGLNPMAPSEDRKDFVRCPQTIKTSNFLKSVLPANKLNERELRRQLIQGQRIPIKRKL